MQQRTTQKAWHDVVDLRPELLTAEALLPDGPYELWREGETARPFKYLLDAFAENPHLPKLLNHSIRCSASISSAMQLSEGSYKSCQDITCWLEQDLF